MTVFHDDHVLQHVRTMLLDVLAVDMLAISLVLQKIEVGT